MGFHLWRQHLVGFFPGIRSQPLFQGKASGVKAVIQSMYSKLDCWEQLWAPYDEPTYKNVLAVIRPEDTVLEIGAGDLRLAIRVAAIARQVYAIEIQAAVLAQATTEVLPDNLVVIPGDARSLQYPPGITAAVLLMRHCTHFELYLRKLEAVGCCRLITNARWRNGMEEIDLKASRVPYDELELGWYACRCGTTGFKTGAVERLTDNIVHSTVEVIDCPGCQPPTGKQRQKEDNLSTGNLPCNLDGSEGPITLFLEGARAK